MGYAQNREDEFVLRYFGNYKGTLLEVGANNGIEYSNSKLLIEYEFAAHLVEPASVFADLQALHKDNPNVTCYNYGIGATEGSVTFYESANHVPGGADKALVSSVDLAETERWRKAGVAFTEKQIQIKTFASFWEEAGKPQFDYISIDAEAHDWIILQQIDLVAVGCKVLIIEWNGDYVFYRKFSDYCNAAGLVLRMQNNENLIFVK